MDPFRPIENKRIFELVADEIREAIFSGTFKPGDRLPSERELSQQMKVGRPIIREALRVLELAGFVFVKLCFHKTRSKWRHFCQEPL